MLKDIFLEKGWRKRKAEGKVRRATPMGVPQRLETSQGLCGPDNPLGKFSQRGEDLEAWQVMKIGWSEPLELQWTR